MTTLRQAVRTALKETLLDHDDPHAAAFTTTLAEHLKLNLGAAGYGIHDLEWCVRIKPRDRVQLGRPMTQDEMILVGLANVTDEPEP